MEINCIVNGQKKQFKIEPDETLLNILRREGYLGVKRGCEEGNCGVCTVLMNGRPVNSCVVFGAKADGAEITTVEGLGTPDKLNVLQEAFLDEGAVQCGFCTPGFLLSASALLKENPEPSKEEVIEALDSNYCRCTGYVKPINAVLAAARKMRGDK